MIVEERILIQMMQKRNMKISSIEVLTRMIVDMLVQDAKSNMDILQKVSKRHLQSIIWRLE
jgi:hypothetical protein